jgi:predicted DNA-binding transcriptional regulator AlpA
MQAQNSSTRVPSRVYRLAQLASINGRPGLLPVSPATIWRWTRDNPLFPKPFKLGASTTVWDASAIEAFISKQQGANE